ncbi:cellulose biosynthesis protein BcsQ [Pseudomonas sp. NCCP-436]|uniref:cellulose biosynthesis protein BcsQ n=1 Tax=Pseudomonas sp. NCCP-436 TaxID=2842481 RepID=UPI001C7F5FD3|nr:cellulose biosynthesis protein BcsQ [Pseudomonas sp. NCCP-436]GIZ12460.1 cellulose synthase operon protein YhjQ [Pseudomonas sp. NCCP-436]
MSVSSDISGLFKWFGGRPERYQEMTHDDLHFAADTPAGNQVAERESTDDGQQDAQPHDAPGAAPVARERGERVEVAPTAARTGDEGVWSLAGLQGLLSRLSGESISPASEHEAVPTLDHVHVVAIVSAKGGVGKTTLSANLAVALQQAGRTVVTLDLDPQNGLRHHFKPAAEAAAQSGNGIALAEDWRDCAMPSDSGVLVLPYGEVDDVQQQSFEEHLAVNPEWLKQRLAALRLEEGSVILVDTPPGSSVYLRQLLSFANAALVVSMADAASYTALPQIDRLIKTYAGNRKGFVGTSYLINQVDSSRALSRDIARVLHELLGSQILGVVHHDPAIGDALAYNRNVLEYDPQGRGTGDILENANALIARLVNAPAACAR